MGKTRHVSPAHESLSPWTNESTKNRPLRGRFLPTPRRGYYALPPEEGKDVLSPDLD